MARFVSCATVVELTLFFALTPLKGAASIVALTFSYVLLAQVGACKNVLKRCNLTLDSKLTYFSQLQKS